MSFYSRGYRGYHRYGAFGDVASAQEAVQAAQAKVADLQSKVKNQEQLIQFTYQAQKNCTDGDGWTIFSNVVSGGATAAVCLAEQTTALNQRKGVLGQLQLQLNTAKAELAQAQIAFSQAKSQAASMPADVPVNQNAAGVDSMVGYTGTGSAMTIGGGGSLLSNPLVIGGGVLALLGLGVVLFKSRG